MFILFTILGSLSLVGGVYFFIYNSGKRKERERNVQIALDSAIKNAKVRYKAASKPINEIKAEMKRRFTRD